MHSPPAFDPLTGLPRNPKAATWTSIFGREMVRAGAERPEVVAITAAMSGPTGLDAFGTAFPNRLFDVGIAEQHAVTSAAGMTFGGVHPVVAVYATFLNRAFDQLLMDVALHRAPVTLVLDRAGVTGEDGPSHHGLWDLSLASLVPGLRVACPRDAVTLADELDEALRVDDGPTLLRFPKGTVPGPVPAIGRIDGLDVLARPAAESTGDVLLISVGAFGAEMVEVAARLADQGIGVTVVDPRWVLPVSPALVRLAAGHELVVTVEDGGRQGGVGAAINDALAGTGLGVKVFALPQEFLEPGSRSELLADLGLTAQPIARWITEQVSRRQTSDPTVEHRH
jgi:1-deoxy-D-xylulose-5-phosphate synthase